MTATTTPRIALIEPLGDPGIGTYAHELAEAIAAEGGHVDLYTNGTAFSVPRLARRHRVFPVLGSALVRQRAVLRAPAFVEAGDDSWRGTGGATALKPRPVGRRVVRGSYHSLELAWWLRRLDYDLVWTQWPIITEGALSFWFVARALGLPLVHTCHNVLPHERRPGDVGPYRAAYRRSRAIVVHSQTAVESLVRSFPEAAGKTLIAPHGLYTVYGRDPAARERVRRELGVAPGERLVLCFGGIRPYKNIEAVIGALASDLPRFRLLVAGSEAGYPDSTRADPLGRISRLIEAAGLQKRAHLKVGPFDYVQTAAIFEAADVVALPYLESYGSGALLLAMSFGKHIVATATGGMQEYLQQYPAHEMILGPSADAVRHALRRIEAQLDGAPVPPRRPPQYEWRAIVRDLVPQLLERCG